MNILDSDLSSCKHTTDDVEELVWLGVEEIETSEIKPAFIKEYVKKVINQRKTFHIIEEIDR